MKTPGAGRCESRGGVGGCAAGEGGRGCLGTVVGGGLCLHSGARGVIAGADPRRFLKMGSSKVPLLEKASEDTGQYQQWWESVTVLERLLCEEEALVTFTSSEIMSRVLSILRVPLRTHQEDDCQVKSALPVRDFT